MHSSENVRLNKIVITATRALQNMSTEDTGTLSTRGINMEQNFIEWDILTCNQSMFNCTTNQFNYSELELIKITLFLVATQSI